MMDLIGWIFLCTVCFIFAAVVLQTARGRLSLGLARTGRLTLFAFWIVSLIVLVIRFASGLETVTNMTDRFPWGVWVGLLQSGVALAAGGFVTAATVHIFHIRRFEAILRPMVLTAFLGYLFVAFMLIIEVGRAYRLWHPLVMWQHTSIMFEVAWCVTLYITVLAVEFSPAVFERLNMPKAVHALHVAAIPIVITGVILSTLHQSAMGSMFLVIPQKIHPLWFSPLLPMFFLISAVSVGLCTAIIESFFSHKIFGRSLEIPLLLALADAARAVLTIYFVIKLIDLALRGAFSNLEDTFWLTVLFAAELIGGVLIPAILFSIKSVRSHVKGLVIASSLACAGVIINRLNVSWFSMVPYAQTDYFPSWMELTLSLFLATLMVAAFGLAVRYLPVFAKSEPKSALPH